MEIFDMERRGRIPVAKFRTQEGKTRSRSRVREPDYNEQDPETDLFTLLEDNIALKEDNKTLKAEIDDYKKVQNNLLEENCKMKEELEQLRRSQTEFETQIKDMAVKLAKTTTEKSALDKLHKMKVEKINLLTTQLESLKENQNNLSATLDDSMGLKSKILKLIPSLANNEMESLIDIEDPKASKITGECIEKLLDEFIQLKNTLNSVELQLYEANEKISDLMENQYHLDEENETLRQENTNLTKVAQLLTQNMKESVQTSKKMEEALIKLKQRNDDLTRQSKDLLDGQTSLPSTPTATSAEPITPTESAEVPVQSVDAGVSSEQETKEEPPNPNRDHGERIVEMKSLMEAAIEKNTNDELKTLHVRLEIMEDELRKALARAEKAESALEMYKRQQSHDSQQHALVTEVIAPLLPPPPPPPLPNSLLYSPNNSTLYRKLNEKNRNSPFASSTSIASSTCHIHSSQNELVAGGGSVGYGGQVTTNSDSLCCSCKQTKQQVGAATGLDALVRELKSGKVTLRRHRRKTRTNDALQEMFQVLEISQKQNRNSQIIIDIHT